MRVWHVQFAFLNFICYMIQRILRLSVRSLYFSTSACKTNTYSSALHSATAVRLTFWRHAEETYYPLERFCALTLFELSTFPELFLFLRSFCATCARDRLAVW